uniref:C-type lectin domain-containing protein n=1 Tax=Acrobeloides nanus TaxID=290746 RepID=A0A914CIC3_9BILA
MTNIFVTIDFDNMGVACPPPLLVHVWIACTAPLIQQLPNIGTRYIVIGKGPFRSGDYDGITYTHGMIASNIVDDGHHIMGDSGNNAEYSGGRVNYGGYTNWGPSQPNPNFHCTSVYQGNNSNYRWQTEQCSYQDPLHIYFCQKYACDVDNYCAQPWSIS